MTDLSATERAELEARIAAKEARRADCQHQPFDNGSTIRCSECGELLDVHGF